MKNKTTTVLLSILIAFGMWLYVITVENPNQVNSYYNVPVVLEGETVLAERELMLVSDPNLTVRVDLQSNRTNLNNINSQNLTIKADLRGIESPGVHELNYTVNFPGNVPYTDVKVVNKQPGTVKVTVAEREWKKIPVVVGFSGAVPENFVIEKALATTDYDTVLVDGPKDVVDRIERAYIEVDCTGRTESVSESYRYILQDANNQAVDAVMIKTDVEEVRVEVPIAGTKKVQLRVKVNPGGGATEETSLIQMDINEIYVSGSDSALDKLDELVVGTVNLADITTATEKVFPITLPEGITNLSGVTEVKVKISFPELSRKDFTITGIELINVPEGMQVDLLTKQLTITVRGPKDLIQSLQLSDITVKVDLTGVENTAVVEPVVIFAEPYAQVGVVGKTSVSVTVSPMTDPAETE